MSGMIQIVGQTSGVSHLVAVDSLGAIKSADASLLAKNTEMEVSLDAILAKNTEMEVSLDAILAKNTELEVSLDALVLANHTDLLAIESSADALVLANHTDLETINTTLGGTLSVSAPVLSTTSVVLESSTSVPDSTTETTPSTDIGDVKRVCFFGSLDDSSSNLVVEVSHDNSVFYINTEQSVYVDNDNFFRTMEIDARYIRFKYTNSSGSAKVWNAILSYKK